MSINKMIINRATVCILTAGKGTRMGTYSEIINKALLPVKQKAIISHIMDKFPKDSEYVIALGYMKDQVKNYLNIVHGDRDIKFVEVDNWEGTGSGPGYSMICCKLHLNKPFYFVSCDTLWNNNIDMDLDENWLGLSTVSYEESYRYCNIKVEHGDVAVDVLDKEAGTWPPYKAFIGLWYIKDHDIFWEGLKLKNFIKGEHQVSNGIKALIASRKTKAVDIDWIDVGDKGKYQDLISKYENYDFSKSNEFLYIVEKKVVKFFSDSSITEKRVQKSKLKPVVFPLIDKIYGQFYGYNFVEGTTLYNYNDKVIFRNLLFWLKEHLWTNVEINTDEVRSTCKKFYYDKTVERIKLLYNRCNIADKQTVVNGVKLGKTKELLSRVPWENLFNGIPVFFHGDLQFDNILYNKIKDTFILLDWRQEFGGHVEWGDLYYDLAKLYGGIVLNYDFIKLNLLYYHETGNEITFDFAQRFLTSDYLSILDEFVISNGWDVKKVHMLVPLIYLNMSPLHHDPFNKMLYSMGRLMLSNELNSENK
ncbi:MAG TPA: NTP transferase domain-containing protein [Candidatus Brocadiaceae bacterium]